MRNYFFLLLKILQGTSKCYFFFQNCFKEIQGLGFWPTGGVLFQLMLASFQYTVERASHAHGVSCFVLFCERVENCFSSALKADNNCILGLHSCLSLQKQIRPSTDLVFSRRIFMSTRILRESKIVDFFKALVQKQNLTMSFFLFLFFFSTQRFLSASLLELAQ